MRLEGGEASVGGDRLSRGRASWTQNVQVATGPSSENAHGGWRLFAGYRLGWPLDGSAGLELARDARRPLPRTRQVALPVCLFPERDHQDADCEPVAIAGSRPEILGHVLEVPADVLHPPLVRADLPAAVDDNGDRFRALDLASKRRSPRSWQAAIQQRFRDRSCLPGVSRAQS